MDIIELQTHWAELPIDELNDNHLIIENQLITSIDEIDLMKDMTEIVGNKGGTIVEVGFGMGISAKMIDSYETVNTHIIIEANKNVYNNLVKYADNITNVNIIPELNFFENWVTNQPSNLCDGFFFDPNPLNPLVGINYIYNNFKEIYRILKPGGAFTFFDNLTDSQVTINCLLNNGFKLHNINVKKNEYNLWDEQEYMQKRDTNKKYPSLLNVYKAVKD